MKILFESFLLLCGIIFALPLMLFAQVTAVSITGDNDGALFLTRSLSLDSDGWSMRVDWVRVWQRP